MARSGFAGIVAILTGTLLWGSIGPANAVSHPSAWAHGAAAPSAPRSATTLAMLSSGPRAETPTRAAVTAVSTRTFRKTPTPTIKGTRKEGSTLRAKHGRWSPKPARFAYQWYRTSVPIPGATRSTYRLTAADVGQRMRVRVMAVRTGFATQNRVSAATKPVASLRTFTATPPPRITGTARVGMALKAAAGSWSPKPRRVTYEWRRNGVPVPSRTGRVYRVTSADLGQQISVTVTATRRGYRSVARTSAATPPVLDKCRGPVVVNPGFEAGAAGWATSPRPVIFTDGAHAKNGRGYAWLGGYGYAATDIVATQVKVPTACTARLGYALWITTREKTAAAYDTLTLSVNGAPIQAFTNLDAAAGYVKRSVDLSAYAGRTVTLRWTADEDATDMTSFFLDDMWGTSKPR